MEWFLLSWEFSYRKSKKHIQTRHQVLNPCLCEAVGRAEHFTVFSPETWWFFEGGGEGYTFLKKLKLQRKLHPDWQSSEHIKAGDCWPTVTTKGPVNSVLWLHHYLPSLPPNKRLLFCQSS